MSGTPSKGTSAPSKNYHDVSFVGGSGRKLFDFELNDAQNLMQVGVRNAVRGLTGGGARLGGVGRTVVPNPNANNITVQNGYIMVNGEVVNTGPTDDTGVLAPRSITPFTTAEFTLTNVTKILYYDVWQTLVDAHNERSLDGATVIDSLGGDADVQAPGYPVDTAQRRKWKVDIVSAVEGVAGDGLASFAALSPPSGHTYIYLGTVTLGSGVVTVAQYTDNQLHPLQNMEAMFRALATYFGIPNDGSGDPNWAALTGVPSAMVWLPESAVSTQKFSNTSTGGRTVVGTNNPTTPLPVTLPTTIPSNAKAVLFKVVLHLSDAGGHDADLTYTLRSTTGPSTSAAVEHKRRVRGINASPSIPLQPDLTEQVWVDYGDFTISVQRSAGTDPFTLDITPIAYLA